MIKHHKCAGHKKIQLVDIVFCQLNMTRLDLRVEWDVLGRGGSQKVLRETTTDSQHGTGVEGSSHPCTKGYHPFNDFFCYGHNIWAGNLLYML